MLHFTAGAQADDMLAFACLIQLLQNDRADIVVETPDPPQKFTIDLFRAALIQVRARFSMIFDPPFKYVPQAGPARYIEEDNRVAGCQAQVQGAVIIAINDPAIGSDQIFLDGPELLPRHGNPARLPEDAV